MKKYLFLVLIGFVFLLPTDTFALFEAANVPWYDTSSSSSSLPLYGNTRYRYQTYTASSATTVVSFYAKSLTFTANKYDYILIDGYIQNTSTTFYYNSSSEYIDGIESSFTVYFEYYKDSSYYRGICYSLGASQNSDYIVNNFYCPIISGTTGINRVIFEINNGAYVTTHVGLSDWFNYHVVDTDASTITSAISSQTSDITDAQQETTDAITDVNESINDVNDSINNSDGNSDTDNETAIDAFEDEVASNDTITSLITMPITLYQNILNSVSSSCTSFDMGTLLGSSIVFPCIDPSDYLGSDLWTIIDVICSGLLIFAISKRFINIFDGFTSMSTTKDEVGD